MGTPSAWTSADSVERVGDLAPRSMSEIIEEETPLLVASSRNVSPNCSRRLLMAWATRAVTLSAIVDNLASIVYDRPLWWTQRYLAR
jgi:hypothetical protein